MSTKLLKLSILGMAGMSMTACASSGADRYGNAYDYESGQGCMEAPCSAGMATSTASTRYGDAVVDQGYVQEAYYAPAPQAQMPVVYADCSQIGGMNCGTQAPVYQQPMQAPVYSQPAPVYSAPMTQQMPTECPAGTTAQSDGTCLQGSSSSYGTSYGSSYGSGSSTSYDSYSSTTTMSEPANCPAGTTAQSDGTCMQGSTSSYSSSTSYGSTSTYTPVVEMNMPTSCPAGTTAQSDGTCMQGTSSTYNSSSSGYQSTYSNNSSYLPIRK